ncbi:MAG: hypothetical protein VKO00_07710 [Cyanobacteriota bacterium]|nr:hypothetical protein [Cyanobacteriota bacterium]
MTALSIDRSRRRPRGVALAALAFVLAAVPPVVAAPTPYAEAVARSRQAADAVLARDGAESCLRGKLTQALLVLSTSCELEGRATALCGMAHRAAVVTPMSLPFMDTTARSLLDLSAGD